MTSPQPQHDLIVAHDTAALAVEAAAVAAVVDPIEAAFTEIWRWLLARWARLFGPPTTIGDGPQFRALLDDLAGRITTVDVDRADELLAGALKARRLGVEQGAVEAAIEPPSTPDRVGKDTRDAVERGVEQAREKLHRAGDELARLETGDLGAVTERASVGRQAVPILTRAARTTFNDELNAGIVSAAEAAGAQLLWIAERDACLACTALSGHVVDAGKPFPDGTQFGRQRGAFAPVTEPGLHPNCRCRVTPWRGHDAVAAEASAHDWAAQIAEARARGDRAAEAAARKLAAQARPAAATDLPTALRREAERAVFRGDSAFDTERARLQAADRLLLRVGAHRTAPSGWRVPTAVKAKARAAIKRGSFER